MSSHSTPAQDDRGVSERHITKTKFWDELMHDIFGPRSGGAIIFIDAENARKGVAKTSGAVAMARLLSRAFRYQLQRDDFTLAGGKYLERYQEQPGKPQPSALVIDELVGAGSGDSRRAMSNQNLDFASAWQMLRTKRVVTLATLPDWNEVDPRLQKYADYRLWCRERPIGYFQPYKVTTPFNDGGATSVQTSGLNYHGEGAARIRFPDMDKQNDPYYQYISDLKDELIHSDSWSADELTEGEETVDADEVVWNEHTKIAIRLYKPWDDDSENSYKDVAKAIDHDERSRAWVGNRVREWKDGEHRELVPDPTETA